VKSPFAAAISGVSSSQVEAMCRFAPASKPAFVKEPVAFQVPRSRERAGPILNACDMPEAQHASKARAVKSGAVKVKTVASTRTRNIKATLFLEEDDAAFDDITESSSDSDEKEGVAGSTDAASGEEGAWACSACTFLNAAVMPSCEMCGAARGQQAPVVVAERPQQPPTMDTQLWPSIQGPASEHGSWAMCDASSIASSWVDMAEDQSVAGDGWTFSEASVVDKTEVPAPTGALSWAQRAAAARSATAVPSRQAPRPAIPGQPARVQPRRPARIAEDEVMSEGELAQLEQRRLCPQGLHPSSQRAARIKESKRMMSFKRKGRF